MAGNHEFLTTLDTKDSVDTISYHFKIFNSNDYLYRSMTVLSGPTDWMSKKEFSFSHIDAVLGGLE